jgi:hypothetical protein
MNPRNLILAAVTALSISACASPRVSVLATQTVQVASNQEADVVWIAASGRLLRCTGKEHRPTCAWAMESR